MQIYVCMNNMTCKTYINAYTYICIITLKSDPQKWKIVKYKMKNWNILNEILMTFLQCFLYMYM